MFDTNRSSYRYWEGRQEQFCLTQVKTTALFKQAFNESLGSAGARTISTVITHQGIKLSSYRASKLMKKLGLNSCQLPIHNYKRGGQEHVEIVKHLNRAFDLAQPNRVWCGDVTYVWVGKHWAYLAVVMDLFSRKPVGCAMSHSPDADLTAKSLTMAFESRGRPKGLMFHSDQGCYYTSKQFRQLLWRYQIKQSMSRRGNYWDNSPMDCFFRSYKSEWMQMFGY